MFDTAKAFADVFELEGAKEYEDLTLPRDSNVIGFTVQRKYAPNIRYKPPKTKDGKDDVVALIRIFPGTGKKSETKPDNGLIPVTLRISSYSRYLANPNHFDYDFKDASCPTEDSVRFSKTTPQPVPLESIAEYHFQTDKRYFVSKFGRLLTGKELLDEFFDLHCSTVHFLKGLALRWKLRSSSAAQNLLGSMIGVLEWTLPNIFGRTIEPEQSTAGFLNPYQWEDLKSLKTDKINAFGYTATKNVIILFCFIVALLYFSIFLFHEIGRLPDSLFKFLDTCFSNGFLAACYSLLFLWILDHLFPRCIFWLLNKLISLRTQLLFKKYWFE